MSESRVFKDFEPNKYDVRNLVHSMFTTLIPLVELLGLDRGPGSVTPCYINRDRHGPDNFGTLTEEGVDLLKSVTTRVEQDVEELYALVYSPRYPASDSDWGLNEALNTLSVALAALKGLNYERDQRTVQVLWSLVGILNDQHERIMEAQAKAEAGEEVAV